jgi:hypothetical protein
MRKLSIKILMFFTLFSFNINNVNSKTIIKSSYPLKQETWVSPRQRILPSVDGVFSEIVGLFRKPTTGGDDVDSQSLFGPPYYFWGSDYMNFSPHLKHSDTLYATIEKFHNGKIYRAKSKWCPNVGGVEYFPNVYLDNPDKPVKAFGINVDTISVINPNIGLPDSFYCWLLKNPVQKIKGDTCHWHDVFLSFNLEKQDSIWQQGDSARINLEKIVTHYTPDGYPFFDKVYRTTKDFAIDTSLIGCMGFRIINFPQESLINDPYPPIIDSISHNLIDGYAILKARIRDYCNYVGNVYDTLHYKIKWQNDSLINEVLADSIVNDYHYYKISGIPANQQCSVYCKIKAKDSFGNSSYALYNFYAYWTKTGENKTYVIDEKNNRRIRVLYLGKDEYKRLKKLMEKGFMVYDISGRRIREINKNRVYILRKNF